MKSTKRIFYFLLITLLGNRIVLGQDKSQEIMLVSPETRGQMKQIDFNINHFNGQPAISVPIYTINTGEISIPLSLNYDASGIKVYDESSWVGQNWSLAAGGVISRQIVGKDDFDELGFASTHSLTPKYNQFDYYETDNYFKTEVINGYVYNFECFDGQSREFWSSFNSNFCSPLSESSNFDWSTDIYSFNFPGGNGRFIIHPSGKIKLLDGQLMNIEYEKGEAVHSSVWTIQTRDGLKYYFNDVQISFSVSKTGVLESNYISSWHLSKIESPSGHIVSFEYDKTLFKSQTISNVLNDHILNAPSLSSFEEVINFESGGAHNTENRINRRGNTKCYLKTIDWQGGEVTFVSSQDRLDQYNAHKLNNISVKAGTNELSAVLDFDYYSANLRNNWYYGSVSEFGQYTDDHFLKRLRLKGINVFGKEYSFDYDQTELPSKLSYASDHWGYFNGTATGTFFHKELFKFTKQNGDQGFYTTSGTNRDSNGEFMQAGILKSITYPTRGKKEFSYSANQATVGDYTFPLFEFSIVKQECQGDEVITLNGRAQNNYQFKIDKAAELTMNASLLCGRCGENGEQNCFNSKLLEQDILDLSIHKLNENNSWEQIDYIQLTKDLYEKTNSPYYINYMYTTGQLKITLPKGVYKVSNNFSRLLGPGESFNESQYVIHFEWTYPVKISSSREVGGLRTDKVVLYDNNGIEVHSKVFKYGSGILQNYPSYFARYKSGDEFVLPLEPIPGVFAYSHFARLTEFRRFSNSVMELNPLSKRGLVGYESIEIFEDGLKNNNRTRLKFKPYSSYHLSSYRSFLGIPVIPSIEAGVLESREIFDDKNILIQDEWYEYDYSYNNDYYRFQKALECSDNDNSAVFVIFSIRSESLTPRSEITTFHSQHTDTNIIRKAFFEYNDLNLLSKRILIDGGKKIVTEYSYPDDFSNISSGAIFNMKMSTPNTYMPGLLIEKVNLIQHGENQHFTKSTLNEYSQVGQKVLLTKVYTADVLNDHFVRSTELSDAVLNIDSQYEELKGYTYHSYGDASNVIQKIVQIKDRSGVPIAYLWSYNHSYPVIKIENLEFSDIPVSVVNSIKNHNFYKGDERLEIQSDINYLKQQVDDYIGNNYLVELNTFKPLIGPTSKTKSDGLTIYYEYDDFGRLRFVKDAAGYILKQHDYQYVVPFSN